MNEKKILGLSTAAGTTNTTCWARGFGFADLENKVTVKINSKFRIGSIFKTLTALAKYVPYFPEKEYPFTIGQLATHCGSHINIGRSLAYGKLAFHARGYGQPGREPEA